MEAIAICGNTDAEKLHKILMLIDERKRETDTYYNEAWNENDIARFQYCHGKRDALKELRGEIREILKA